MKAVVKGLGPFLLLPAAVLAVVLFLAVANAVAD